MGEFFLGRSTVFYVIFKDFNPNTGFMHSYLPEHKGKES